VRARSLEALGLNEVAWTQEDALQVLDQLRGMPVAILGGDVYSSKTGHLMPTYDNWCCDRHADEDFAAFAARSQRVAAEYIAKRSPLSEDLIVLVSDGEVTAGL
jgi:hypothetical protein